MNEEKFKEIYNLFVAYRKGHYDSYLNANQKLVNRSWFVDNHSDILALNDISILFGAELAASFAQELKERRSVLP